MIDREAAQAWLDDWVRAWQTYDPGSIGALFTEDADYYRNPFEEPTRGREAIVASWLAEQHLDEPDGYEGRYVPIAIDGSTVVAHGRTRFFDPRTGTRRKEFDNLFVLRLETDGRCSEFREWYSAEPEPEPGG